MIRLIKYYSFVFIFLVVTSAFISSCKTDFSVAGEYDERPIIHFIIDPSDEIHFMKLNKTFLGDGNAFDFAKVPDSSYFDTVHAVLQEVVDDEVEREWVLYDTIIENKEDGAFYAPEQKLYCFRADDLGPPDFSTKKYRYRLNLDIENGKHIVTGEIELVRDIEIDAPSQNIALNFMKTKTEYGAQQIRYTLGNAEVYNTQLIFRYREVKDGAASLRTTTINIGTSTRDDFTSSTGFHTLSGNRFYEILRERIPVDNAVTRRQFRGFEIIVTAGSQDLNNYMIANKPTSSLTQNKPVFTNVEGALGIFSSRRTVTMFKPQYVAPAIRALSSNSTEELCEGALTIALGFCSEIPLDNDKSFACN